MRRSLLLLSALLLVLAGCGRPSIDSGGSAVPRGPAAPGGAPEPLAAPAAAAPADQRTEIFIAVLRRYLQADTSFPPDTFRVVFVLDHTEPDVGDPMRGENPKPGPTINGQAAIVAALADVTRTRFVPSRASVIEDEDRCATVRDGGILITLGEPEGTDDRVKVPVFGYVACLGATWLTYVVERSGTEWQVTGTTGTTAIS